MAAGPYARFPMVDVRVVLLDGSAHEVDSSEQAFRTCAAAAFREACRKAGIRLLEPMMDVEVTAPEADLGPCWGAWPRGGEDRGPRAPGPGPDRPRRGPLAAMFGYTTELRGLTSGRGQVSMRFARYEAVPTALAEEIIAGRTVKSAC